MPTTYRYEISKGNRASCQVSACKDGPKIQKGELRFGSLVTMRDYDTWKWKHWGCVTPVQIANVQQDIEGLDIDDDDDMNVLDGWEDLPEWARDKIKQALKDGHVADEDWKGDPEKNRQGQKGLTSARKKKATKDDGEGEDVPGEEIVAKPKKKRMTKKEKEAAAAAEEGAEDELAHREETPVPTKKRRGKKVKDEVSEDSAEEVMPTKKKRAAPKKRKAETVDDDTKAEDEDAVPEPPVKKARAKKVQAKKEEDAHETIKGEEGTVADAPPKKKGRPKKVQKEKKEEPDTHNDMSDQVDLSERTAWKTEEQPEDVLMADLPEAKPAKPSGTKKVVMEAETENNQEDMSQANPKKPLKAKKVKQEAKDKPVKDEHDDRLQQEEGEPASENKLLDPLQQDESVVAEEIGDKPKLKKGKGRTKKAR